MHPDAVNMYLSYLHEARDTHALADMLLYAYVLMIVFNLSIIFVQICLYDVL